MTSTQFAEHFTFDDWTFNPDAGELHLHYVLEKHGRVSEKYVFGTVSADRLLQIGPAFNHAAQLLHWMAGVSYYKTGLAEDIRFQQQLPNADVAKWLQDTWYHGLGELAYENGLSLAQHIHIESTTNTWETLDLDLQKRSLVAIGGGKDSLVSIELLKQHNEDISLFMVGQSEFIQSVAAATDRPIIQVKRFLDPKLAAINAAGAFNGHVPITAINNCVAVLVALLFDYDAVVFSNEASADQPNVVTGAGESINHQYSKSFAYEKQWQQLIERYVSPDIKVFSLLRPFSELAIVRQFAQLKEYFPVFSSCNRNFHLSGSQNQNGHWCGQCPKCHFVFLTLAPFIDQHTLLSIFGDNLLARDQHESSYRELLGLSGIKPFECVGEIDESRLALQWLAREPDWMEVHLVKKLWSELSPLSNAQSQDIMGFHDQHLIPPRFLSALQPMRH